MDSQSRSLAKSLSYRLFGSTFTALIIYLLTGNLKVSAGAGLLDSVIKVGLYFVHERIWERVPFGRPKPPEYEI